jgi:hypothetical protein
VAVGAVCGSGEDFSVAVDDSLRKIRRFRRRFFFSGV